MHDISSPTFHPCNAWDDNTEDENSRDKNAGAKITGVNISQKNQNYSVRGLRKFQKYSELLKKIPGDKVQNLCFGRLFVHFWANFWSQKEKST